MMQKVHDTLYELDRGTPFWFTASGWLMPAGILTQFLLAGRALFAGGDFATHAMLGSLLALPILALLLGALLVKRLRGFRWWAGILAVLTLVQFALAASDGSPLLAYHPLNGALLLVASLVLLAKIERRLARVRSANLAACDRADRELGGNRRDVTSTLAS